MIYHGAGDGKIGTSAFKSDYGRTEYVGLKYTIGSQYGTDINSNIYNELDAWYTNNVANTNYASYIDINAGFCGDRDMANGYSWSSQPSNSINYAAYERLYINKSPVFICSTNNLYTYTSSTKGNKSLSSPIGLITADEVAYAGGVYYETYNSGIENSSFYLYTGSEYWTMSPLRASSVESYVIAVTDKGTLHFGYGVSSVKDIRLVINLKSTTQFTGSGTSSDPYTVV